jgi:hypothetical protein
MNEHTLDRIIKFVYEFLTTVRQVANNKLLGLLKKT